MRHTLLPRIVLPETVLLGLASSSALVCRRIIVTAFNNDKSFQNVLNTAFEHFINLSARAPEYISLFMDDQLRKVAFQKSSHLHTGNKLSDI